MGICADYTEKSSDYKLKHIRSYILEKVYFNVLLTILKYVVLGSRCEILIYKKHIYIVIWILSRKTACVNSPIFYEVFKWWSTSRSRKF